MNYIKNSVVIVPLEKMAKLDIDIDSNPHILLSKT